MLRSILFSVAPDSYRYAVREIRETFPGDHAIERVAPDLGRVTGHAVYMHQLASACTDGRIMYIRHLTLELASFGLDDLPAEHELAALLLEELPGRAASVQAWTDAAGTGNQYRRLVAEALENRGVAVSQGDADLVVSCIVVGKQLILGTNHRDHSLSDWPGGRMRLARSEERVSRSEFKLEEAIQTFGLELVPGGRALDLGASPGGWTRILRQHGQEVWSVDPGGLDPRLGSDRKIHHEATTAGRFFTANRTRFDVVVNDMRMDQVTSARMMLDAVPHLRPEALAVVTLKGGGRNPLDATRRGLDLLRAQYTVQHARQLHHNRNEVTVVARRR